MSGLHLCVTAWWRHCRRSPHLQPPLAASDVLGLVHFPGAVGHHVETSKGTKSGTAERSERISASITALIGAPKTFRQLCSIVVIRGLSDNTTIGVGCSPRGEAVDEDCQGRRQTRGTPGQLGMLTGGRMPLSNFQPDKVSRGLVGIHQIPPGSSCICTEQRQLT